MPHLTTATALIALLAATEIAWWEGRWVERGMSCNSRSGDPPLALSADSLLLGEAECNGVRERAKGRKLLLSAKCRDHGETAEKARTFILQPFQGGRGMTMTDGSAVWRLSKCPSRPTR